MHLGGWRSRERTGWLKSTDIDGVTLQRMYSIGCLLQTRKRQTPLARSLANPSQFFPKRSLFGPNSWNTAIPAWNMPMQTHTLPLPAVKKLRPRVFKILLCVTLPEDVGF